MVLEPIPSPSTCLEVKPVQLRLSPRVKPSTTTTSSLSDPPTAPIWSTSGAVPLWVLGMHRSGTSLCVRALAQHGLQLPPNLLPAAANNPDGFQESADLVALNNAWLAASGATWDATWPSSSPPAVLISSAGLVWTTNPDAYFKGGASHHLRNNPKQRVPRTCWPSRTLASAAPCPPGQQPSAVNGSPMGWRSCGIRPQ